MPRAKKRYGQHFLRSEWADKLVTAIEPRPGDRFLEIGPGPGALTLRLAPRVAQLTAVEVDREMVELLRPQLPGNVTLIEGDVLDVAIEPLLPPAGGLRVAGNLPYNLSSPILFRLLELHRTTGRLIDATLMLQREVAERIEAGPGTKTFGVLSIFVQLHADVRRMLALPPGAFRPAPKVQSSVLRLAFRGPAVRLTDEPLFEAMVRSMFTQRRKTISNALRPFAEARGAQASAALRFAGIDPTRRPETLQLDEMARLAEFFATA
ncbi:MAG TPA: 16S rRNA (adenine(1518)-N(6)/adenine(1519)-N(6))-dimethyltransferase RsmA [Vicinamibacterales bacterium]|nr:16S rRNA (adenine(1518)-N(6)/adenine(1519)-N(6))-dimethyltransferase RsmA [Vicinamibacterales bacterium]